MPRHFNSFLIRWWRGDESERVEIEHIQSGRQTLTTSIEAALPWLHDQQADEQQSQETQARHDDALDRGSEQQTCDPTASKLHGPEEGER